VTLRARKRAKPVHKNRTYKVVTPIDAITLREIINLIKDLTDGLDSEFDIETGNDLGGRSKKLILRLEKILSRIEY
jgi:hypothetical protein